MDENVNQIALAGLLHDIGKLEQRARADPWNPAPGLEDEGQPVHATWSAYFVQTYVPARYQPAALAGTYHHNPEKSPAADPSLSMLVALADKLSAGERADQPKDYPRRNLPQQMITIYDQLALEANRREENFHYLPLAELKLDEDSLFPAAAAGKDNQAENYERLRVEMEQASRHDPGDEGAYLEQVLAAMRRLTWCIPSAYYHSLPDVSLYDHSRMTAALAVCLREATRVEIERLLGATKNAFQNKASEADTAALKTPVALLVGGDISGIQKFIYTISSKGAARTLRGRSFYLQLLTEAVLRYVMRALDLPATNVIYSGGGHFYLLAPLSAHDRLQEIQLFITKTLLDLHGVNLYLALGCTKVPAAGFQRGKFPEYWGLMHADLARAKLQRYTELGEDLYEGVFKPQAHGGNQENTCSVCGEERPQTKSLDDRAGTRICSLCASFETEIGKRLPKAKHIVLGFGEPRKAEKPTAQELLSAFGMQFSWADPGDEVRFDDDVDQAVVWALEDVDSWPQVLDVPVVYQTRYTVNQVPEVDFNKLAKMSSGIERLGVLRMDVDNLGDLFMRGFGSGEDNQATLARLSTLSFLTSIFFEGWIKVLCDEYPGMIYAVYAGGDDVFLIGPWDIMPSLAERIAGDLSRYTGGNPDIHISGGMSFIHGKYPVYQAADDAEGALETAKGIDGKDAFCFLGQAWKWDEFRQIRTRYEQIRKIVGKKSEGGLEGPRALIQTLRELSFDEASARTDTDVRTVYGPWMWRGIYRLKRMEDRSGKNRPLAEEIAAIRTSLDENEFGDIAQWGTAARWAQLATRNQTEG